MRIFVTGATGFIGSAVLPTLTTAGHQVIGLTRSDAGARLLEQMGVEVHRGTLEDPESMRLGAEKADAVIHTAFDHDFSRFVENCQKDGRVIAAMGEALKGSNRPLVITSGTGLGNAELGGIATESVTNFDHPNPRVASELAGNALLEKGVNVSVVRLPQVHNTLKQGLISPLVEIAKAKGVSAYVGQGKNRFPAGHLSDVALLYRLAIERGEPGARYNAVGEEGVETTGASAPLGHVARGAGCRSASWGINKFREPTTCKRLSKKSCAAGVRRVPTLCRRLSISSTNCAPLPISTKPKSPS
jgi:nucleoside-diphosphate-sugar epimerase